MKKIVVVAFFAMFQLVAFCQKEKDKGIEGILDDEVFDRMIIQEISHSITGENAPVTGIKIDVSKPKGTVSGTFPLNKEGSLLFGFDLKGGVTDKSFNFLKGYSALNTAFEFRPALYVMPSMSGGKHLPSKAVIVIAKNDLVKAQFSAMQDTFKVMRSIYIAHLINFPKLQDDVPPPAPLTPLQIQILFALVRDVLKADLHGLIDTSSEAAILAKVPQIESQNLSNDEHMKSSTTESYGYKFTQEILEEV